MDREKLKASATLLKVIAEETKLADGALKALRAFNGESSQRVFGESVTRLVNHVQELAALRDQLISNTPVSQPEHLTLGLGESTAY